MHDTTTLVEKIMQEHVKSYLVEQLQNIEEEVHIEAGRVEIIGEDFVSKISARKDIEGIYSSGSGRAIGECWGPVGPRDRKV